MQGSEGAVSNEFDGLSVRAQNALYSAGLTTVEELARMSDNQILSLKNCGKTTLHELRTYQNKTMMRGGGVRAESLTKREWLAGQAVRGLVGCRDYAHAAEQAVAIADAILVELDKTK